MASVVGIPSEDSTTLGVPDLLLELDRSGRSIALFILEVNFSQDLNDLFKKVKRFASSCGDVQAITIIDIHESQPHKKPGDTSELAHEMMGRDLLAFEEWNVTSDNPAFGSVHSSIPHPWVSPLTITVETWLRHPDGEFSIDESRETDIGPYYSRAVIHYNSL
jgi:hypothetical protein